MKCHADGCENDGVYSFPMTLINAAPYDPLKYRACLQRVVVRLCPDHFTGYHRGEPTWCAGKTSPEILLPGKAE